MNPWMVQLHTCLLRDIWLITKTKAVVKYDNFRTNICLSAHDVNHRAISHAVYQFVWVLYLILVSVCLCDRDLLKLFITSEIMRWSDVCATHEKELRTGSGASVFSADSDSGNKRWADLKIRAVEHVWHGLLCFSQWMKMKYIQNVYPCVCLSVFINWTIYPFNK